MNIDQIAYYKHKLEFEVDSFDLNTMLNDGSKVIIIDVRSEEAYKKEHIPVSISLPHREINNSTTGSLSKDVLYITYCDGIGCNGSTKGALKLAELGFNVKELIGGLDWWKRDGYETEGEMSKITNCGC